MKSIGMKKIFVLILSLVFMFSASCVKQLQKEAEDNVSLEQKEKDLITLLQADQSDFQDKTADPDTERLLQRIAELEQDKMANLGEINRLRSELLLKDEKIRQLEDKTGTEETASDDPGVKKPTPTGTKTIKPKTEYEREYVNALDLFRSRKYRNSLDEFSSLLQNDRNNALADNCQYWIGECYFALKNYQDAIIAFEKVFTYMNSNKDDDAQIKLGICYFRLNDMDRAKLEFEKLIRNYSKSEYVSRANNYLSLISR
ncbi:tol-pal system YbgF family protein [candidate division KSB1 bacterium]